MLASITPLGERGRGNRWWPTALAYELGSVAGGAMMGAAGGAIGLALRDSLLASTLSRAVAAAAVAVAALSMELAQGRVGLPTWHRQVDKAWLDRYRGWVYGAGFGLQLGTGVVTIVNSAAMYALVGLLVVMGAPVLGIVVGGLFGLARALPLLAFGRAGDFASMKRAHRRLDKLSGSSRLGSLGALAGSAIGLVAVAVAVR